MNRVVGALGHVRLRRAHLFRRSTSAAPGTVTARRSRGRPRAPLMGNRPPGPGLHPPAGTGSLGGRAASAHRLHNEGRRGSLPPVPSARCAPPVTVSTKPPFVSPHFHETKPPPSRPAREGPPVIGGSGRPVIKDRATTAPAGFASVLRCLVSVGSNRRARACGPEPAVRPTGFSALVTANTPICRSAKPAPAARPRGDALQVVGGCQQDR